MPTQKPPQKPGLIAISEIKRPDKGPTSPPGMAPLQALSAIGFRPFFFLSAIAAVLYPLLWALVLHGKITVHSYFGGSLWHGHEMVFGIAMGVIAGFLLTAIGNWTQQKTLRGPGLVALAALWLAGRIAVGTSALWPPVVALVIDGAFLPLLALAAAIPIIKSGNRRNMIMPGILVLMGLANLCTHLGALGWIDVNPSQALQVGLDLVLLILTIIAGRVLPFFTRRALNVEATPAGWVGRAVILSLALVTLLDVIAPTHAVAHVLAMVAGGLHLLRMRGWHTGKALRIPLLAILHLGHLWLGIGLILKGLPLLVALAPGVTIHGLTVGCLGAFILGMMARVSLGHSGRPLLERPVIRVAFILVALAAIVRVGGAFFDRAYLPSIDASATLWTMAFLAFVWVYTPILLSPRADGKPDQ